MKDIKKIQEFFSKPLNESRIDQSKMFDQSEVDEIIGEIREITGILEDKYSSDVGYSEYRFGDGTGGFSFKWSHARNWGGRFGLSIRENGEPKLSALSWYDKSSSGSENIKSGNTNVQNVTTWEDLDNSMLVSIWAQLQPMVIQNEINAKASLDKEAKAQAEFYGKKADTGRIGYGLSSQPRMRNESLNPEVSKALDRFIKAMAKRYSYSEKDAVFAIQAALKQRDFRDEEKSSKFKKSGEEAGFDMRGLKESTEKSWDAIDVSRKAEKELGNKEWNERTTKKLDILKAFNKSGKFKKDWSEEKLQGWVDKNYSWEKLSQQFKLKEGSCGYTPDGEPRDKPSGSHLLQLKEKIYNSFKE